MDQGSWDRDVWGYGCADDVDCVEKETRRP
jgi:hypothetical protein